MSHQVLVTGASGFVGSAVVQELVTRAGFQPIAVLRKAQPMSLPVRLCADFNDAEQTAPLMQGIDCVVHCAARVHMMNEQAADPLTEFRAVNTKGTLQLARQAAKAGVKRFIFLSSVKVLGESTSGQAFCFDDPLAPQDPYGVSKAEAETALHQLGQQTGMEIVIIRPPLVYGPGVKANFAAMLKLAKKNLPLPLGAIDNKRSLVALDNLVDLICVCIRHPAAANQTFLVSDDEDVSTTELLQRMIRAHGKTPRLLPIPASWLRFAARLLGKKAVVDRLCGSLQVDISHTKSTLGWQPPLSLDTGIQRCLETLAVIETSPEDVK